jgi:hypothetical protein
MTDTPVFQGHHVIEQGAYAKSELLQALSEQRLFDLHGPRNLLNLPADQALAARLGVSPHPGGPLGEYSKGLELQLQRLQQTPDGQATLRGDRAAAERMAVRVGELTDTLKTGLVNGDLHSNTPQGTTRDQTNRQIRNFFGNLDEYRQTHSTQIAEIGRMPVQEARWAGVTRSEGNVTAALDAIEQPGAKPVAGDLAAGRQSLGTAIAEANSAGRLPVSEPLELRLRASFPREMPTTLVRPPVLPEARVPLLQGGALPEAGAPHGSAPGSSRVMRVVAGGSVAVMAADFAITGHRVLQLRAEGNEAAAASAQTHWVGRNAGGVLGGIGAGFVYGAVAGSETGPGALVTGLIGAGVGAYLGERWADRKDIERVFTQRDGNGNKWTRDPANPDAEWLHTAPAPNGAGGYEEEHFKAVGHLANELNYKAANASYSLGLGSPSKPQDPFSIPGQQDQSGWLAGPWQRDAETKAWSRTLVAEGIPSEIPLPPDTRQQPATPAQSADLERRSDLIIAQNVANTPAVTAARYQIAYNQFSWHNFASMEPVPGVIRNASTQTQTLQASDEKTYTRGAGGEWTTSGTNQAMGNIREELNRTWQSQQAGLQEMSGYAAEARKNPTQIHDDLRSMVVGAYASAGISRSEADIDAATLALKQNHARNGIGQSPFNLKIGSDGSIATLVGQDDRRLEIKSVTTAAEIEQARTQRASPTETPQPNAPTPSSPTTRSPGAPTPDHAALDDAANPRNGMFQQALGPVRTRDAELGRTPDEASVRLAAGMTAGARERGLETIAFAQFSPDGQRFYMANTSDPSSPWAKTAVGDVGQALQQSVAYSTLQVAQLDQQAMTQQLAQSAQQQTLGQGGPVMQGPRLA